MYAFSKTSLSFYPESLKQVYTDAGSWPADGVEVTEEIYNQFTGAPPQGKTRGADENGYPAWVDITEPEIDIDQLRQQKRSEIENWRNEQENGHYIFEFNGANWDYSKQTQDRLTLAVDIANQGQLPEGFFWTDADNNDVPMTSAQVIAFSDAVNNAMFAMGLKIHVRQREMKTELDQLTSKTAVINYPVGWKTSLENQ